MELIETKTRAVTITEGRSVIFKGCRILVMLGKEI